LVTSRIGKTTSAQMEARFQRPQPFLNQAQSCQ
jgi:hypothetical protein